MDRIKRLKKLVAVQQEVKALHEMRHAGFLAKAADAAREAADLGQRADAQSPIASLFPDLYSRRIGQALDREAANRDHAAKEAARIASETVRGSMIERQYREARSGHERGKADIERLETISRKFGK